MGSYRSDKDLVLETRENLISSEYILSFSSLCMHMINLYETQVQI